MSTDNPRSVSLSPATAVDSIAEWPLGQVVQYLRKKEKEEKGQLLQPVRLFCRSSIKGLSDVLDALAVSHGASRNRMSRWASYHGMSMAREDTAIARMSEAQTAIRSACLLDDDMDTLDMMNGMIPYSPRVVTADPLHLQLYDAWVSSDFEDMARVCGVHRYRVVQVYLVRSVLTADVASFREVASRLETEVHRWDVWMSARLAMLEQLATRKRK